MTPILGVARPPYDLRLLCEFSEQHSNQFECTVSDDDASLPRTAALICSSEADFSGGSNGSSVFTCASNGVSRARAYLTFLEDSDSLIQRLG